MDVRLRLVTLLLILVAASASAQPQLGSFVFVNLSPTRTVDLRFGWDENPLADDVPPLSHVGPFTLQSSDFRFTVRDAATGEELQRSSPFVRANSHTIILIMPTFEGEAGINRHEFAPKSDSNYIQFIWALETGSVQSMRLTDAAGRVTSWSQHPYGDVPVAQGPAELEVFGPEGRVAHVEIPGAPQVQNIALTGRNIDELVVRTMGAPQRTTMPALAPFSIATRRPAFWVVNSTSAADIEVAVDGVTTTIGSGRASSLVEHERGTAHRITITADAPGGSPIGASTRRTLVDTTVLLLAGRRMTYVAQGTGPDDATVLRFDDALSRASDDASIAYLMNSSDRSKRQIVTMDSSGFVNDARVTEGTLQVPPLYTASGDRRLVIVRGGAPVTEAIRFTSAPRSLALLELLDAAGSSSPIVRRTTLLDGSAVSDTLRFEPVSGVHGTVVVTHLMPDEGMLFVEIDGALRDSVEFGKRIGGVGAAAPARLRLLRRDGSEAAATALDVVPLGASTVVLTRGPDGAPMLASGSTPHDYVLRGLDRPTPVIRFANMLGGGAVDFVGTLREKDTPTAIDRRGIGSGEVSSYDALPGDDLTIEVDVVSGGTSLVRGAGELRAASDAWTVVAAPGASAGSSGLWMFRDGPDPQRRVIALGSTSSAPVADSTRPATIAPNPSTGRFRVATGLTHGADTDVVLVDATGRAHVVRGTTRNDATLDVDATGLAAGAYVVTIGATVAGVVVVAR